MIKVRVCNDCYITSRESKYLGWSWGHSLFVVQRISCATTCMSGTSTVIYCLCLRNVICGLAGWKTVKHCFESMHMYALLRQKCDVPFVPRQAVFRKATVLHEMGQVDESLQTFLHCLALDEDFPCAKGQVEKVREFSVMVL